MLIGHNNRTMNLKEGRNDNVRCILFSVRVQWQVLANTVILSRILSNVGNLLSNRETISFSGGFLLVRGIRGFLDVTQTYDLRKNFSCNCCRLRKMFFNFVL
jgi:hypothetical protein